MLITLLPKRLNTFAKEALFRHLKSLLKAKLKCKRLQASLLLDTTTISKMQLKLSSRFLLKINFRKSSHFNSILHLHFAELQNDT